MSLSCTVITKFQAHLVFFVNHYWTGSSPHFFSPNSKDDTVCTSYTFLFNRKVGYLEGSWKGWNLSPGRKRESQGNESLVFDHDVS